MPCKKEKNALRNAFIEGLPIMLERLKPKYVIVYGRMPDEIFAPYKTVTKFINFKSDLETYFNKREEEKTTWE